MHFIKDLYYIYKNLFKVIDSESKNDKQFSYCNVYIKLINNWINFLIKIYTNKINHKNI